MGTIRLKELKYVVSIRGKASQLKVLLADRVVSPELRLID